MQALDTVDLMEKGPTVLLQAQIPAELSDHLNELRRQERDFPTRSVMVRRLIERAYARVATPRATPPARKRPT